MTAEHPTKLGDGARHRRRSCLSFVLTFALVLASVGSTSAMADVGAFEVEEYIRDLGGSEEKAERSLEIQERANEFGIVEELEQRLGQRYAGVWFDNDAGEFVVPLMPGVSRGVVADELAKADLDRHFRTAGAQFSWAALEASQNRLDRGLRGLIGTSLVQTSIDPRVNAVVIRAADRMTKNDEAELLRHVGEEEAGVDIKKTARNALGLEPRACATVKPRACDAPLRGGVQLAAQVGQFYVEGLCTAGFKAVGNTFGNRFILTAGHCAGLASSWASTDSEYGVHPIGNVETYSFPGGDWGAIKANGSYWDTQSWPSMVAHYWEGQERSITSESSSYLGQYVCHSGNQTGTTCGNVLQLNLTADTGLGLVYNVTEFGSICSWSGDSGGPVFAGNTAIGLYHGDDNAAGETSCYWNGYYVEITDATNALQVTVASRVSGPATAGSDEEGSDVDGIQPRQATVHGWVDPNGASADYHAQYGTDTAYGQTTASANAGSGWQPVSVSRTLTNLKGNTTYHYRLTASNSAGSGVSPDQTFTTPAWPPIVTTNPASDVSAKGATFHGTVDGQGAPTTTYHFEYVRQGLAYGTPKHSGSAPVPEATLSSPSESVQVRVDGIPDGKWRYRLVATNDEGTSYGSDQLFEISYAPKIVSASISDLGASTVTFHGSVIPESKTTTVNMTYGLPGNPFENLGYEHWIGNGFDPVDVSDKKKGLQPETDYEYRLGAWNNWGNDEELFPFHTLPSKLELSATIGSSGSGNGQLERPLGLAVDGGGDLWVVDHGNDRLQKFNAKGEYVMQFGSAGTGNGQFNDPTDVAIDGAGNLWVADSGNDRLQKFNAKGEYLSKFGSSGSGPGQFTYPARLAIAPNGNIWVSDELSGRVEEFTPAGSFVRQVTGFHKPSGIEASPDGHIWVADRGNETGEGHRVVELSSTGTVLDEFGSFGTDDGEFETPTALVIRPSGDLLVADRWTGRVQQFTDDGEYLAQFGAEDHVEPEGMAVGPSSVVYVANSDGDEVSVWQPALPQVGTGAATDIHATQVTVTGTVNPRGVPTEYYFEYGPTDEYGEKIPPEDNSAGDGSEPVEVSATGASFMPRSEYHYRLVAETSNGQVYGEDKTFKTPTEAPPGLEMSFGSSGSGNGQFDRPKGITFDHEGNIWVADSGNDRIQKFSPQGEYLFQFGTSGTGPGQLYSPSDVASNGEGALWVADSSNHRLQKFTTGGSFITSVASTEFTEASRLMFGPGAFIWASDALANRVKQFNYQGQLVQTIKGAGVGGSGPLEFSSPGDMVADQQNHIRVVDTGNHRVQEINHSGEYLGEFGSQGSGNGQFEAPTAIGKTPFGDLLVSDRDTGRVQQFTPAGDYVLQFGAEDLVEPEGIVVNTGKFVGPGVIQSQAYVTSSGSDEIQVWTTRHRPGPIVEDESVVSGTEVVLRGTVNPNGLSTEYYFEYGATPEYGTTVPVGGEEIGSGFKDVKVEETIDDLDPGTTYHYRLVAVNSEGVTSWGGEKFTTGAVPKATTSEASDVHAGIATLNGSVDAGGLETEYWFEYGTTTAYDEVAPVPAESVSGTGGEVEVEEPIDGLEPGTTYHFRLVALNEVDVARGEDKTFTTKEIVATTEAATFEQAPAATLKGSVNPEGVQTSYHFEYVGDTDFQSSGYENATAVPSSPKGIGSGIGAVKVNETVGGLTPGEIYHFRVVATGAGATVYGGDKTLTAPALLAPTYQSSFGSSGTGNGQFNKPADAAVDASGNVWVADRLNNRIQKFNSKGEYVSQFGTSGSGNGQLNAPAGVAIDASGNIWVADGGNRRVQKFSSAGSYLAQFGSQGSGNGQFTTYGPKGIAIDASGNIWVTDYSNRVQKFNSSGGFLKSVTGFGESTGIDVGPGGKIWIGDWTQNKVRVYNEAGELLSSFGSSGSGNGQFSHPDAVEVDTKGNVWIGDEGNSRVQRFNQAGEYVAKFGSSGSGEGQFKFGWPFGLTSDDKGNLWIADTNNHRVQRWLVPGYPTYQSSFGSSGTGNGQLKSPADVAVDASGNIWVADRENHRIQKFNSKGEYVSQFGSFGTGNGQLSSPSALAIDASGNIWVGDGGNRRAQKFSPSGEYLAKFGSQGSGNGQFTTYGPKGIAIDASGNIWVSDYSGRIQKFNPSGEFLKAVGSKGTGDGQFGQSAGIDVWSGKVWVADWEHDRVSVFSEAGEFLFKFGSLGAGNGQLSNPDALDVDSKGNVFVGEEGNSRVQQFNSAGEYVTKFGSNGTGAGQFKFGWPFGLVSDDQGSLWIADKNNHRVQRWGYAP